MASRPRWTAVGLCLLLAAALAPAPAGAQQGGLAPELQQSVDPDDVRLEVDLREDGAAVWTVEYRVRLETENETAAFEDLRADVAANRSAYVSRFAARIRATVADAENATGREMRARNFSVETSVRNLPNPDAPFGVVTYRFRWEGFAAVEGDRISTAGTLGGLFLTERQSLSVSWPAEYDLQRVEPGSATVRENEVIWDGPISFGEAGPTVVIAPAGVDPAVVAGVGLTAVVVIVVGVWAYRNRNVERELETPEDPDAVGEAADDGGGDDERPPEELMSNEERVLALLEEHGGRIKQQEVVSELDWTAAKTSQVVTEMREDGQIEVFRLGRENVIKLPDTDLIERDGEDEDGPEGGDDDRE
ncbi:MAG: helix-turn-helix transcriptional regulator [Halobacteriaceae archaeon]